ncbi:MAG: adenylate/guanylate cyclase domain-containing protein [Pseudomonadota bacterium]|nr:MAG: adenylate/guanylate cyclase domain-containing protein [Pseudomonadota bacterium]
MAEEPQQRRLAAILSADVAGYSRLMHEDEEATVAALNKARQQFASHITQFHGRVVDTAGDSVLAEFRSLVDAMRCAVEIQQVLNAQATSYPEVRRMLFRIGVSLGDVLVENDAIYGDGVNIAARVQTLANPGGICLSGGAYNQVKDKLDLPYEFIGKQQVKNISDPVPVYRIGAIEGEAVRSAPATPRGGVSKRAAWLTGAAVALVGAVVMWNAFLPWLDTTVSVTYESPSEIQWSNEPSLVVLPFNNMSKDPDQDYLSDGITEDLITNLSRLSNLTVIARTSAFTYKGKTPRIADVARDLKVRFVLEGSVQKAGDQVRITAKLIDSRTAHPLWAQRYDRKLKDIFAVQDDVSEEIVKALALRLTASEKGQLRHSATDSFAAYDLFLRGRQYFNRRTKEDNELARDAYRRAIALDPTYARPYGALAVATINEYRNGWSNSPTETKSRALELAKKAVALDNNSPPVYWSLGFVYLFHEQYEKAAAAVKRAIALAPSYADGYGLLAFIANFQGRAEDAVAYIRKAMALNPYHTYEYPWNLGRAYYTLGRYTEAAESLEEANQRNENSLYPRLFLAATYVRLGRQDDAAWQIDEIQTLNPGTTLSHLARTFPMQKRDQLNAFLRDLRKAGLPE